MKSAVLMIVFCRPETTKRVFEAVRKARPSRLYVASDAPRDDEDEISRHNEVQRIFDYVDWPCSLKKFNQEKNVGCSRGPYEAISWFFKYEKEGIILEDDIIPEPNFFNFCDDMLEKYRSNDKIQMISGWSYFYKGYPSNYPYSYYYSTVPGCWGWATWKNRWDEVDLSIKDIEEIDVKRYMSEMGYPEYVKKYYIHILNWVKNNVHDCNCWDYQFMFYMWKSRRFSISPIKRLTMNIGFGKGATHNFNKSISFHKSDNNIYPIKHPSEIRPNIIFDIIRFKSDHNYLPTIGEKIYLFIRIVGGKILRLLKLK